MAGENGHVVFRADGGQRLGLGHIKRCEVLAREMQSRGCRVTFLTVDDHFVCSYISRAGFDMITLRSALDRHEMFDRAVAAVRRIKPGVLFLDILNTEVNDIKKLKETGVKVVSIDDLGRGGAVVDALVGVDIGVLSELLPASVKRITAYRIYAGLEYAIIPPEITKLINYKHGGHRKSRKIFIGFGGSDPRGSTAPVIEKLLGWEEEFHADVVIGPCVEDYRPIMEFAARDKERFTVHRDPKDLAQLMADASMAIGGVGQSLFELTMLGTPSLLVSSSPLHARFADNYQKYGCSVHLGQHNSFSPDAVVEWCRQILNDEKTWNEMHVAARRAIDGNGAHRICNVISGLLKTR